MNEGLIYSKHLKYTLKNDLLYGYILSYPKNACPDIIGTARAGF